MAASTSSLDINQFQTFNWIENAFRKWNVEIFSYFTRNEFQRMSVRHSPMHQVCDVCLSSSQLKVFIMTHSLVSFVKFPLWPVSVSIDDTEFRPTYTIHITHHFNTQSYDKIGTLFSFISRFFISHFYWQYNNISKL